jgi:CheY-like chemotaxis protein
MSDDKKVILVVDDNANHRTVAAALLAYGGYAVLEAESLREADQFLAAGTPDLILVEVPVDRANLLDWIGQLRNDERTSDVRIAAHTEIRDTRVEAQLRTYEVSIFDKAEAPLRFLDRVGATLRGGSRERRVRKEAASE